ncbi:cytochrome P450 71A21-like [Chenopodium quinoa]|uniref:Cytochrome P450 n=1 Tax=Chenopodium quinoa TaxID=63459 RepID=A0A803MH05_CHEQI|nr:cytochrome P450 71A21-like [Chenopodium quinoa]
MQITNMSFPLFFLPFIVFSMFLYKLLVSPTKCNKELHLPPTPPMLPIVGNLHQLGRLPHRSLQSLSIKYGDLMLLYFGNRPTFVVSSSKAAKEIMKTREHLFLDRPNLRFIDRIFYHGSDVGFSSYGDKWRHRKSICVRQLLSNKSVQSFRPIREEEVARMIKEIKSYGSSPLNLSEISSALFKCLICRTALGRKIDAQSGKNVYKMFKELAEVMGALSVGDYIPFLGWIDKLTGLEDRVANVHRIFDVFLEEVIQEHEIELEHNNDNHYHKDDEGKDVKDFVEVMLEIQRENPEKLSRDSIKGTILDLLGAGTDTSTTLLGWAMTELLRHPNIMKKLQEEVRNIVKPNTRVTEHDLENMKYLKAVIKETLRLHPPVPLSGFRESTKDVKIDKYNITARAQVIVNAWAIQRDPQLWHDPENFHPERFLNDNSCVDFRGQHFQLIPFGSGRRGCPGVSLGIVTIELVLASLVYEFNWTLPNGRKGETLDVGESWGVSVRRKNPLIVIATHA